MRKFTAEVDRELLRLRELGRSWDGIAMDLAIHKGTCWRRWHALMSGEAKVGDRDESPSIVPSPPPPKRVPLHIQLGIKTVVYRVPRPTNRNIRYSELTSYMDVTLARI